MGARWSECLFNKIEDLQATEEQAFAINSRRVVMNREPPPFQIQRSNNGLLETCRSVTRMFDPDPEMWNGRMLRLNLKQTGNRNPPVSAEAEDQARKRARFETVIPRPTIPAANE